MLRRALYVVCLFWTAACNTSGPPAHDPDLSPVTPPPPPTCALDAIAPGAWGLLAEGIADVTGFGACGDLIWVGEDQRLWRALPDLTAGVETAAGVNRARWSPDRTLLAYGTDSEMVALDLETGDTQRQPPAWWFGVAITSVGPVPWLCQQGVLSPFDGSVAIDGVRCNSALGAEAGSTVVFMDAADTWHVLDLEDGSARALPDPRRPTDALGRDRELRYRQELSPDGRVLTWREEIWEYCGDTECLLPGGGTTLIDLTRGETAGRIPAQAPSPNLRADDPGYLTTRGGHTLLFPGQHGGAWLVDARLDIHASPKIRPLYLYGDGHTALGVHRPEGERFSGYVRFDALTGAMEPIVTGGEAIGLSTDEATLAVSHSTGRCIRYPGQPNVCHRQIWALSRWTQTHGLVELALADQPMRIFWIGDDGTLLIGGRVFAEPVPEAAEPGATERVHGLHVLAPDGTIRATLGQAGRPTVHEAGELLLVTRWIDRQMVLDVVDPTDGATRRLLEGDRFDVEVGPAGRRVAVRVYRRTDEGETTTALWAGATPRP